jgi:hypothetical protein
MNAAMGHGKQDGLILIDCVVIEIEAVTEIESSQVAGDRLNVLRVMIEADRQFGAVLANGSLCASQRVKLCALNIHLDEIEPRQAKPLRDSSSSARRTGSRRGAAGRVWPSSTLSQPCAAP